MKKFKSFLAILFVLTLVFSLVVIPSASAYNIIGKRMIGGIRNRYFWFDSSVTGYWSTPFYNGINRWYNTSTYYAFTETSNRNSSQVDFYTYSLADNAYGYTEFFISTGNQINPAVTDWKFCDIKLNRYYLQSTTTDFDSGVVCHEIGHTIGLNENNTNKHSIMCQSAYGRLVTSPGSDDVAGTNYLYPNGYY